MSKKPVKRALLSVSDKTGLVHFARSLLDMGVDLLSSGGTAKTLQDAGIAVTEVSDYTGFPEMLDGRVKTLHPKIHGGILGKRDGASHEQAMQEHQIDAIDLVVVNLYPFEQTVAAGKAYQDCVEQIDIGGPALIRSASKNHEDVTVIVDVADYDMVIDALNVGGTDIAMRKKLAAKAFSRTASYDAAISAWFAQQLDEPYPESLSISLIKEQELRYGENPHQSAAFYRWPGKKAGLAAARQIQGKALSYNNLNDTDAAFQLVKEFDQPAAAIIKHANPCGVAVGKDSADAFRKALLCDPKSAFGGIIALNRVLDIATIDAIGSLFVEVIIAPDADKDVIEALSSKKNLRVLLTGDSPALPAHPILKPIAGGVLVQDEDRETLPNDIKIASKREPSPQEMQDMKLAFTVAKHVKSNAIVLVKDGATIGIGAGQMSRVDSVRIATLKAQDAGLDTKGAVLASDAFFPFDDNVHLAAEHGISGLIQPGGSIRDDEVFAAADSHDMTMLLTGMRHFRH